MTAKDILRDLNNAGVEVVAVGEALKIRSRKAPLTEAQRQLITENRPLLLAHLCVPKTYPQEAPLAPSPPAVNPATETDEPIYREYVYPNGDVLKLTREEFDNVVDVFRLLLQQDTLLQKRGKEIK